MTNQKKRYYYKEVVLLLIFSILLETTSPTNTFALTGGPTQPEFSSFEPVATTNLVDEFTGDFTYNIPILNIPGANGGGYALSLSYHSGAMPEEEASWVGYGWTLNPGSIVRNKRGFPDDWNGKEVKYWNKTPSNETVVIGGDFHFEAFSADIPVNAEGNIRYNNYRGFGYGAGVGVSLARGVISLGYHVTDGEGSFSLAINPANILNYSQENSHESTNKEEASALETNNKANSSKYSDWLCKQFQKSLQKNSSITIGSIYGLFSGF